MTKEMALALLEKKDVYLTAEGRKQIELILKKCSEK
jgi:hypothetical protein